LPASSRRRGLCTSTRSETLPKRRSSSATNCTQENRSKGRQSSTNSTQQCSFRQASLGDRSRAAALFSMPPILSLTAVSVGPRLWLPSYDVDARPDHSRSDQARPRRSLTRDGSDPAANLMLADLQ